MTTAISTVVIIAILAVLLFSSAVRIFREYERGVMFTLGRYTGTKGPGLALIKCRSCSNWCALTCVSP